MHKKHIFVGGRQDIDLIYESAPNEEPLYWAVPESSEINDQGFFLLPKQKKLYEIGFCALGEIVSDKVWDGNKWTGWRADVSIIYKFDPNMPLKIVQEKFRDWPQVQHPTVWNRSFEIDNDFYLAFYNHIRYGQKDDGRMLHQLIR